MTFSWEHTFDVPADRGRVFDALTDAQALRVWFAEHVEIEPREGGAFRFSGRGAYAGGAEGRITAFEPGRRLGLAYPFDGIPGEVQLRLEEGAEPTSSKLQLTHTLERAPAGARARELMEDLWRLYVINLWGWFGDRSGILLPDFDDPTPKVELSIFIAAPPAKVFRALLDPEMLKTVFGAVDPQVEPRAGGAYVLGWSYEVDGRQVAGGPTRILEITPNERLVTDWPDWRGDPAMPTQRVTWTLAEQDGGTHLTLVHDGFTRWADIGDYPGGWGHFLGQLKQAAETAT